MIRIKPLNNTAPNAAYWSAGDIPPYCAARCSRGCRATQSINVWYMVWQVSFLKYDEKLRKTVPAGSIYAQSVDHFMDQYGCYAIGPPPRSALAETIAQYFLVSGPLRGTLSDYWNSIKPDLIRSGGKEPGTITMLPTPEAILGQLLAAQRAFA